MAIPSSGFVIHINRLRVETRGSGSSLRYRTVGDYQCYFDGARLTDPMFSGASAEPRGPGDNSSSGVARRRRIEAGTYPLGTHKGQRYQTNGYNAADKKPAVYVRSTGARTAILIHPGGGFKSTVGCINITGSLVGSNDNISSTVSRARVVAVISEMKKLLDGDYPAAHRVRIPDAWLVIDGEP